MSGSAHIIDGIEVRFPYSPYESQTSYMEAVIKSIKGGKNALLESPTGTGKTLSLICATLACLWNNRFRSGSVFNEDREKNNQTALEKSLMATMAELRNSVGTGSRLSKPDGHKRMHIIYASRTHSQLKQVIREAKKSSYAKEFPSRGLKAVLLGSRDQMCIHPARGNASGEALNTFCRTMIKNHGCLYYSGLKKGAGGDIIPFHEFMDIEDILTVGKSKMCCPYYAAKDMHESADITLLPYNYLLSPISRGAMELKLHGAIVVIDEAHNVETVAEEAASFSIRQIDISRYIFALKRFVAHMRQQLKFRGSDENEGQISNKIGALEKLAASLKSIDDFLSDVVLKEYDGKVGIDASGRIGGYSWQIESIKREHVIYKADEIVSYMLNSLGFGDLGRIKIEDIVKNSITTLSTNLSSSKPLRESYTPYHDSKILQDDIKVFESLRVVLQHLFSREIQANPEYFYVFITKDSKFESPKYAGTTGSGSYRNLRGDVSTASHDMTTVGPNYKDSVEQIPKVMSFECLQATPSFLRLKDEGVRSIILASGTLSPLDALEQHIGGSKLSFEIKLTNGHVIDPSRVWTGVITGNRTDPQCLSSVFSTRISTPYVMALGESLLSFIKCVPSGILVFFGSYTVMEKTITMWKQFGIYGKMEMIKSIFVECRPHRPNSRADNIKNNKSENTSDQTIKKLEEYKSLIDSGKGCVFIGVCRGKIAEGIDFTDDYCRGVFVCGIPYPNPYEDNVALKIDYLRRMTAPISDGSVRDAASSWYFSQAVRAINQAIGRSIRHIKDYGAILLADRRYRSGPLQKSISSWALTRLKVHNSMDAFVDDLKEFFRDLSGDFADFIPKINIDKRFPSLNSPSSHKTMCNTQEGTILQFKSRKTIQFPKARSMPHIKCEIHKNIEDNT